MQKNNITLGLVDDHNLFREGIKFILETIENVSLVLEAVNGKDMFTKLKNHVPDVILLDLEMEIMNGVDATIKLKESYPDMKIIILTMHQEPRMISYLMEIGANGYLLKDSTREELEKAIVTVYERGNYFNEYVSEALLKGLKNKTGKPLKIGKDYHLTAREMEVLQLIADGLTTSEIGEKLYVSARTIETHRQNLKEKLGVRNTSELMVKAFKENLIQI